MSSSPLTFERPEAARRRPPRSLRALPLRADVGVTFAVEFLVLGASLLTLRLAATHWGAAGFGDFVLARRALGWIQLPALLGLHLALARFVAMAEAAGRFREAAGYLRGGTQLIVASLAALVALLLVLQRPLAFLLLGDAGATDTMRAVALAIAGLVAHTVAYGALRGRRRTRAANALQALSLGIVPLVAITLPGVTVVRYLTLTGGAMLVGGALVAASMARGVRGATPSPGVTRSLRRELLAYGAARVPGELALGALFALPVVLAAHRAGAVAAGQIGLALSLLQLVGALFSPLGQAMLPAISARVAKGELAAVRRMVRLTALGGIALATLSVMVVVGATPWVLSRFFGPEFVPAVPLVRIVVVAGVPYGVYVLLRAVLDAVHCRPLNARNLVIALAAFLVVALTVGTTWGLASGILVAMTVLGGRTLLDALRSTALPATAPCPAPDADATAAAPMPPGSEAL